MLQSAKDVYYHVFLSQHLSFMITVKRKILLLKGSLETRDKGLFIFVLRFLFSFSVKHVGKMELI